MRLYAQLDCAFARDPKMVAAGPMPRLLYVHALLYGRENLTDGRIDKVLLPIVAMDIPAPAKHMQRLVDVGAIEDHDTFWRIPEHVWSRWNPTAEQVEQKRQAKRQAGALGNHKRWHVDGNTDPNCSHCATAVRNGCESQTVATVSPKTEPETEPKPSSVSRKQLQVNRTEAGRQQLIEEAATIVVGRRDSTGKGPGWMVAARNGIQSDITTWAASKSLTGYSPQQLADEFEPPPGPKLREINGRMCQHIPGTGFVPVAVLS